MTYTSSNTIRTVAGREMAIALRNKGIIFSMIITLLIALAGIGVGAYLKNRTSEDPTLVVVGMSAEEFTQTQQAMPEGTAALDVTEAPDRAAAEDQVKGNKDAALIATEHGYELLSDGVVDTTIHSTVAAVTGAMAQNKALDNLGITPQEFGDAMGPTGLTTTDISEDPVENHVAAVATVMMGVMLMVFFIMLFAGNIGARVTEEKSSRVVEIILASVRPLDFLMGKLLGNTVVGLVATAIIVAASSVGLAATGLTEEIDLDMSVMPMILVSFVLGMLFFGSLYAAAGSMVRRTEDLQSTQMPILLLIFGMVYAPAFGFNELDSTIMQALSWIPPFSLAVAPMQFVAGNMSLGATLGVYGICLVVLLGVMMMVARIYRNAILNNGKKMTWLAALK